MNEKYYNVDQNEGLLIKCMIQCAGIELIVLLLLLLLLLWMKGRDNTHRRFLSIYIYSVWDLI